jgi:ribose transport system substrate-binding protein
MKDWFGLRIMTNTSPACTNKKDGAARIRKKTCTLMRFFAWHLPMDNRAARTDGSRQAIFFRRHAALTFALVLFCGCGHRGPATIMVITPTGGLERWEDFDHAVEASARADAINTEVAAPQAVTDYTEQAQMVETAIDRHVQGIIVSPAHQLVLNSVLQKAVQDKIPVVIIGSPIAFSENEFAAFVGWDEAEAGRLAARKFVTLLHAGGEVGVVGVSPTIESSSLIERAFTEEISKAPRVKLVGVKYGLSDWARSRQAVLDLLAEHPKIKGIFTTDEFSTHAASFAFDQSGQRRPVLIGISDEVQELNQLKAGRIDALIISDPRELGTQAMQAMRAALSGGNASAYSTQLPVYIVDKSSMESNPVVAGLFSEVR